MRVPVTMNPLPTSLRHLLKPMRTTARFAVALWLAANLLISSTRAEEFVHPLFKAVRMRDRDRLAVLLHEGAPVNVVDAAGNTPLLIAARDGDLEAVRSL